MGFEPTYNGFANRCLTTWLPRQLDLCGVAAPKRAPRRAASKLPCTAIAGKTMPWFNPGGRSAYRSWRSSSR